MEPPSIDDVLREHDIPAADVERTLLEALYAAALERLAERAELIVDDPEAALGAEDSQFLFVVRELLDSTRDDIVEQSVRAFSLSPSTIPDLERALDALRGLPRSAWARFSEQPAPESIIDPDWLRRRLSSDESGLGRRRRIAQRLGELLGARGLSFAALGIDALGLTRTVAPYLDMQRYESVAAEVGEALRQWRDRVVEATDEHEERQVLEGLRAWIREHEPRLRFPVVVWSLEPSMVGFELVVGTVSDTVQGELTALAPVLQELLPRLSEHPTSLVRQEDEPSAEELADFVEVAVDEMLVVPVQRLRTIWSGVETVLERALVAAMEGRDFSDLVLPLRRQLERSGTEWLVGRDHPRLQAAARTVELELGLWLRDARGRFQLLWDNWEPIERRLDHRVRSWTEYNARFVYLPDRQAPQLEVEVFSGVERILHTTDDIDDVLHLGLRLVEEGLDALQRARSEGMAVDPEIVRRCDEVGRRLLHRLEHHAESPGLGEIEPGSGSRQ